ncbi:MAG: type II CAAX endopeptidase family protein [Anaerococcus sp.]|nr:type II CAAX endopeptidase family protein [Anaerococcus sp.]
MSKNRISFRANGPISLSRKLVKEENPFLLIIKLLSISYLPQLLVVLSLNIFNKNIDAENLTLISLYMTSISSLLIFLYARKSLGFSKKALGLRAGKNFKNYLLGLILGGGLLSLSLIIGLIFDIYDIRINIGSINPLIFLAFLIGWIFQGFHEELMVRGILMTYFASHRSVGLGLLVNSLIFSTLHLGNTSFGLIACINIFLLGLIFSFIYYLGESLYLAGAAHSFWNFFQANIFGIRVSGIVYNKNSIFITESRGQDILSGGAFGIEGSLIVTILGLLALLSLYKLGKDKGFISK